MANDRLTAISLFAGGGGLSLGFRQAGFDTILASDIEPSAARTFELNWPRTTFWLGDVQRLSQEQFKEIVGSKPVDLVLGGPPCQGFSTIGSQDSADPRNSLFRAFARVLRWSGAKSFLMENVNYLRTQYGGRYEEEIRATFQELGYRTWTTTLNAADYGVPQIRKRVFFFGTKLDGEFVWPESTHGEGRQEYVTVGQALQDLDDTCTSVPNHSFLRHSAVVQARYRLIPEGGRMPPPALLPEEIRRKNFGNTYKRLHRDKPSLTLVPGNNAFPIHPTEDRSLSPREGARIQTFPDDYVFAGSRAEQCKLVGNAVPVVLGRALGNAVASFISQEQTRSPKKVVFRARQLELVGTTPLRGQRSGLKAVSFFTGIGGLLSGFLNAGFDVSCSFDQKKSVARNLATNFPELRHITADVAALSSGDLKRLVGPDGTDVVFGGPPCQGFSLFGRRRFVNTQNHKPESDERNELALHYIDLALCLKPKAIFLENVKGFTSTRRGVTSYLDVTLEKLRNSGFDVYHQVVNCAEFGVPQSRERFVLVAVQHGISFEWPVARHFAAPKSWQRRFISVGDVITDLMDSETYSADFSHVPMEHKELVIERYKLIPEGGRLPEKDLPEHLRKGYRSDLVKNFSHVYRRLSMDAPATTMVPGHNAFPVHPRLNRTLTVREAARIQTFPDWMRFSGTRQQQCTLVGNAVPPLLAEIFAVNILKAIRGNFVAPGYKRDVYDLAVSI